MKASPHIHATVDGAMFDKKDEGTAMLKLAPTLAELPVSGTLSPLQTFIGGR